MTKKTLITGGAGFIGSHLADELVAHGHHVRVLDNLDSRAHSGDRRPAYINPEVDLVIGDVRDGDAIERALEGVDVVFHLASVGAGSENSDEVDRCTSVNNVGTAILMDRLVRAGVGRLIVGSSMSIYGEGLYRDEAGRPCDVTWRTVDQLERADWEPWGGLHLRPVPTPETKGASFASVYAAAKYEQERMCLRVGRAFQVPTTVLRFFNVFGPRQCSSSSYAGDFVRIAARLLSGRHPYLAEDGGQRRDFIDVRDVAIACRRAMHAPALPESVINVGRGESFSFAEIAQRMATVVGKPELTAQMTGNYAIGDVRHCFADVRRARCVLGLDLSTEGDSDIDVQLLDLIEWVGKTPRAAKPARKHFELRPTS